MGDARSRAQTQDIDNDDDGSAGRPSNRLSADGQRTTAYDTTTTCDDNDGDRNNNQIDNDDGDKTAHRCTDNERQQ